MYVLLIMMNYIHQIYALLPSKISGTYYFLDKIKFYE